MNGHIEQYLCAYVDFAQNDWVRLLPSAEFAINNHDSTVTGISPFFAIYGLHPRSGSEPSAPLSNSAAPTSAYIERLDAEYFVEKFREIGKFMIENIEFHFAEYEIQANKFRQAARNLKPGDLLWLNLKNLKTLRPSKKLDYKNAGP